MMQVQRMAWEQLPILRQFILSRSSLPPPYLICHILVTLICAAEPPSASIFTEVCCTINPFSTYTAGFLLPYFNQSAASTQTDPPSLANAGVQADPVDLDHPSNDPDVQPEMAECSVCYQPVVCRTNCGHYFCGSCIVTQVRLTRSNTCPMCQTPVAVQNPLLGHSLSE